MLCKGNGLLPLKILGYVGINSFFFFPITNYVPEAFTTLIHNGATVAKFGSYAVGGVIAWVVSEAATCTKRHKCRKR